MRALLTLACVAALGGCAIIVNPNDDIRVHSVFSSDKVDGNGMPAREERAVSSLQRLDVSGPMVVDVRVGPAPSLVVEADSNLLPLIRTEASGDGLRVWTDRSFSTRNPIRITYTTPGLTEVRASGSGRTTVAGLDGAPLTVRRSGSGMLELSGRVSNLDLQSSGSGQVDALNLQAGSANLKVTGSGNLSVGEIRGEYANVDVAGSGRAHASGAVRTLSVRVHSSGSADLERLVSEQADLSTNGSGNISANVRQALVAQANSSGSIRVYGKPALTTLSGKRVYLLN